MFIRKLLLTLVLLWAGVFSWHDSHAEAGIEEINRFIESILRPAVQDPVRAELEHLKNNVTSKTDSPQRQCLEDLKPEVKEKVDVLEGNFRHYISRLFEKLTPQTLQTLLNKEELDALKKAYPNYEAFAEENPSVSSKIEKIMLFSSIEYAHQFGTFCDWFFKKLSADCGDELDAAEACFAHYHTLKEMKESHPESYEKYNLLK